MLFSIARQKRGRERCIQNEEGMLCAQLIIVIVFILRPHSPSCLLLAVCWHLSAGSTPHRTRFLPSVKFCHEKWNLDDILLFFSSSHPLSPLIYSIGAAAAVLAAAAIATLSPRQMFSSPVCDALSLPAADRLCSWIEFE